MAFTTGINTARTEIEGRTPQSCHSRREDSPETPSFTWENIDVDWSDGDTFDVRSSCAGRWPPPPAPDPTLKALSVSGATLSPAFDPETVLYTAVMDSNTDERDGVGD